MPILKQLELRAILERNKPKTRIKSKQSQLKKISKNDYQNWFLNSLTPIELPSDEEILKNGIKPLHGLMDEWDKGFLFGAKLMHFLIQGGKQ